MVEPETNFPPKKTNDTTVRVLSSMALIPLAVLVVYVGGWPFTLTICLAALAMVNEWVDMIDGRRRRLFFYALVATCIIAIFAAGLGHYAAAMALAAIGGMLTFGVCQRKDNKRFWAALGALYLIVPCVALIWLRSDFENGRLLTFMLFVVVWSTDIGAFFTGRIVGGPKLNPVISPKKTWAGTVGGVAAGAIAFASIGYVFFGASSTVGYLLGGCGLAISSVIGDMVESAMKRGFGVKDSGNLIPGHGGVLDRLDGMIFATIALALTLWIYRNAGLVFGG